MAGAPSSTSRKHLADFFHPFFYTEMQWVSGIHGFIIGPVIENIPVSLSLCRHCLWVTSRWDAPFDFSCCLLPIAKITMSPFLYFKVSRTALSFMNYTEPQNLHKECIPLAINRWQCYWRESSQLSRSDSEIVSNTKQGMEDISMHTYHTRALQWIESVSVDMGRSNSWLLKNIL